MISDPLWLLLLGMAVVVGGILFLRLHAFLALILGAVVVGGLTPAASLEGYGLSRKMAPEAAARLSREPLGERVARRFGNTCAQVGILVAMASLIGKCMLESGAADRIVRSFLALLGEGRAGLAFLASGFLLGIPVFFDTVFLLMIPLGKVMGLRTGRNYLLYVLTIVAGSTMAHSLVPPTPGPLFVATQLKVGLGPMILGGAAVGLVTSLVGYLYARWANRRWVVPLRGSPEASLEELRGMSERDASQLPPLWLSLCPILLPVVLIGGRTLLEALPGGSAAPRGAFLSLLLALGDKDLAVSLAAAVALAVLLWRRRSGPEGLGRAVEGALGGAGIIILITAAGGAFGGVLQETGIGQRIQDLLASRSVALLPLAFGVTALVRTAQGSATVAMITAAGVLSGLADPEQLGFHPLYLALAIGCGSKPLHWMNDSGFWVICRMSGMTSAETLRFVTPMTALMGLAGLLVVMAAARLLPLV